MNISLEHRDYNMSVIALESKANPFSMLAPVVKVELENISKKSSDILSTVSRNFYNVSGIQKEHKFLDAKTETRLVRIGYPDMVSVVIPVPAGFKQDLTGYTELLNISFATFMNLAKEVLEPTDEYLSYCLSDQDAVNTIVGDQKFKSIAFNTSTRKAFANKVAMYFDNKSTTDTLPFGKVFARLADYVTFCRTAETLAKTYRDRNIDEVQKMSNKIAAKAELIYVQLASGKLPNLQNETARKMSVLLDNVARDVEFYAALLVLIDKMINVAREIEKSIAKSVL